MFPVEMCYLAQSTPDYVQTAIDTIFSIHLKVCRSNKDKLMLTFS